MNLRDVLLQKFKLIIFDLDGTLVQSHALWDEARGRILQCFWYFKTACSDI